MYTVLCLLTTPKLIIGGSAWLKVLLLQPKLQLTGYTDRLDWAAIVYIVCFLVSYSWSNPIVHALAAPAARNGLAG